MTAKVKWDGYLSSPFTIRRDVRQGGILSASHYKRYNNSMLIEEEDRFTGTRIGMVKIPHVTVADDMCFVTEKKNELQPMLASAELQANREHSTIHPVKTAIKSYNTKQEPSVKLYGKNIQSEDPIVHLGIHRNSKCTPNIEEKIGLGRRTACSLLGARFHGKSGLKQSLKADTCMWRKYGIPRLIYWLEHHENTPI